MLKLLHGKGEIWPEITGLVKKRQRNLAAVAFVAKGAHKMLPLTSGDTLVVDMSPWRVRSGATDPWAVKEFLDKRVNVYTCDGLHAKVFVLGNHLVVGSTNLSQSSNYCLDEAVLATTETALVEAGKEFIEQLLSQSNTTEVDIAMVERLAPQFREKGWHTGTTNGQPRVDWPLQMMRQIAPASVNTSHGQPYIEPRRWRAIQRIYLRGSGDTAVLNLNPADTKEQAKNFYGSLDVQQMVGLGAKGWQIDPNFHLGYRNANLRRTYATTSRPIRTYLNFWRNPPSELDIDSARMPRRYGDLVRALLQHHLMQLSEVNALRRDIRNRPWVSLRPGVNLSYTWSGQMPTADAIVNQINAALITWREKVQIRGNGNARHAVVETAA